MHQKARIFVTQFCNPSAFSNAHGLLSSLLQCKASKNNKIKHLNKKLAQFLFDTETVLETPKIDDTATVFFLKILPSEIEIEALSFHCAQCQEECDDYVADAQILHQFSKVIEAIQLLKISITQDTHQNSNKRFALRKSSIL